MNATTAIRTYENTRLKLAVFHNQRFTLSVSSNTY